MDECDIRRVPSAPKRSGESLPRADQRSIVSDDAAAIEFEAHDDDDLASSVSSGSSSPSVDHAREAEFPSTCDAQAGAVLVASVVSRVAATSGAHEVPSARTIMLVGAVAARALSRDDRSMTYREFLRYPRIVGPSGEEYLFGAAEWASVTEVYNLVASVLNATVFASHWLFDVSFRAVVNETGVVWFQRHAAVSRDISHSGLSDSLLTVTTTSTTQPLRTDGAAGVPSGNTRTFTTEGLPEVAAFDANVTPAADAEKSSPCPTVSETTFVCAVETYLLGRPDLTITLGVLGQLLDEAKLRHVVSGKLSVAARRFVQIYNVIDSAATARLAVFNVGNRYEAVYDPTKQGTLKLLPRRQQLREPGPRGRQRGTAALPELTGAIFVAKKRTTATPEEVSIVSHFSRFLFAAPRHDMGLRDLGRQLLGAGVRHEIPGSLTAAARRFVALYNAQNSSFSPQVVDPRYTVSFDPSGKGTLRLLRRDVVDRPPIGDARSTSTLGVAASEVMLTIAPTPPRTQLHDSTAKKSDIFPDTSRSAAFTGLVAVKVGSINTAPSLKSPLGAPRSVTILEAVVEPAQGQQPSSGRGSRAPSDRSALSTLPDSPQRDLSCVKSTEPIGSCDTLLSSLPQTSTQHHAICCPPIQLRPATSVGNPAVRQAEDALGGPLGCTTDSHCIGSRLGSTSSINVGANTAPLSSGEKEEVFLCGRDPFTMLCLGGPGSGTSHTQNVVLENLLVTPVATDSWSSLVGCGGTNGHNNNAAPSQQSSYFSSLIFHACSMHGCESLGLCRDPRLAAETLVITSPTCPHRADMYRARGFQVQPLCFKWPLSPAHILAILHVHPNSPPPVYGRAVINVLRQSQREPRRSLSIDDIQRAVESSFGNDAGGRAMDLASVLQQLDLLRLLVRQEAGKSNFDEANVEFDLAKLFCRNRLVVVDLTDPLLSTRDVNAISAVVLNLYRLGEAVTASSSPTWGAGRIAVFDDADRYFIHANSALCCEINDLMHGQRREGVRLLISTKSLESLPCGVLTAAGLITAVHRLPGTALSDAWRKVLRGPGVTMPLDVVEAAHHSLPLGRCVLVVSDSGTPHVVLQVRCRWTPDLGATRIAAQQS